MNNEGYPPERPEEPWPFEEGETHAEEDHGEDWPPASEDARQVPPWHAATEEARETPGEEPQPRGRAACTTSVLPIIRVPRAMPTD